MNDVVIVEAVRTPVGRRNGGLSTSHSVDILGTVQKALFERSGVDPSEVGQVVGGCVGQVGMQSMNVTRTAWLSAGLPLSAPATTVDAQCGSSQQATNLAYALVASGTVDVAVGCGVELMSRVGFGATTPKDPDSGRPINRNYFDHFEFTSQFEGSERIADQWEISRTDTDTFGVMSQERAARAWDEDRFGTQIIPVEAPAIGEDGEISEETIMISKDEGLRETTMESLAALKPTGRKDGVHTAGTSSQISDGAGALLLMTSKKAAELGVTPLARIIDTCLVGSDPELMLTGPIGATHLAQAFGGKVNRNSAPNRAGQGSRKVVRTCLIQLEESGLIEKVVEKEIKNIDDENQIIYKGRVITPAGHKLLDEVARETRSTAEESYPELKDY